MDFAKATTPEQWRWEKRQESLAQASYTQLVSSFNQNMQNNNSDGKGDPKRPFGELKTAAKIGLGIGIPAGMVMYLANSDPSSDPYDAAVRQARGIMEQQQQLQLQSLQQFQFQPQFQFQWQQPQHNIIQNKPSWQP